MRGVAQIPEVTEKVRCGEKEGKCEAGKSEDRWGDNPRILELDRLQDCLANVPQLLPPLSREEIINQSRHLSDTLACLAYLDLSWNFLTLSKTAAGTGSHLLLLT